MRPLLIATLIVIALFSLAAGAAYSASKPPNIVIILADDQGWGDLSVHGNKNLSTPQIDSLASRGAMFDRFYVCSVCAPTRAEFLTGRYHSRGGVRGVTAGQERLNPEDKTIADTFRAAGYATGAFGKWHNGSQWPYHPNARGFQEYYGFTSGHWGQYFDPILEHNGKIVRGKGFIIDDFTNHALEFIEKNKTQPFFCYVALNTPHSPFQVPDLYWHKFQDRPLVMFARNPKLEDLNTTRCVLAMCENIDWNVGRILSKLESLKLEENTIVIYFSDNGPNSERWNDGMKGRKGSVDEGGLRVPFLIRWPGHIAPGLQVKSIAGAIDMLPTLASMATVKIVGTKPLDGRDLSPILLGKSMAQPERIIFSHQNGRVSVRTQQYRLDAAGALFDMVADPGQEKDIAAQQPDIAEKLKQAVMAWRKEVLADVGEDTRPYPVGYLQFPWTPLPARDGVAHGRIQRSASAPNCSYYTNWRNLDDSITWDIEVHTTGKYEALIYYTCPKEDIGSIVELSFQGSKIQGKVERAFNPPLIDNMDRVPRKGETYMKDFQPLRLGLIQLNKGRGQLTLQALKIPGKQVMDMRGVTLTLMK